MAVAARENAALNGGRAAIEAIVARLADLRLASAAAILIVALACMLPGIMTIPPIDREEPHFAQAVKRMVETGGTAAFSISASRTMASRSACIGSTRAPSG